MHVYAATWWRRGTGNIGNSPVDSPKMYTGTEILEVEVSMQMPRCATLLAACAGLILAAIPLLAHHSFAAEYASKEITLTGTITKVEWTNPHIYFYIDVKDSNGNVQNWAVEGYPPNTLKR